jgi:hypothetical protein
VWWETSSRHPTSCTSTIAPQLHVEPACARFGAQQHDLGLRRWDRHRSPPPSGESAAISRFITSWAVRSSIYGADPWAPPIKSRRTSQWLAVLIMSPWASLYSQAGPPTYKNPFE